MPDLLVVGGGLFGSLAATYARSRGITVKVFDPSMIGAASPAAACLFKEAWVGKKLKEHFDTAVRVLDELYGIRHLTLENEAGESEPFLFVPPSSILEAEPVRETVTGVGDGWLEAGGQRHEGWVYIAAGIWCTRFLPDLNVHGKAGAAFAFPGEREGRIRQITYGRQALAFVRDPGSTYFSDGTAESDFNAEHERRTLNRAADMGLTEPPESRYWGYRPYTPKGPVFCQLHERTWLATGGRKMGTILGASFAKRLVDHELVV